MLPLVIITPIYSDVETDKDDQGFNGNLVEKPNGTQEYVAPFKEAHAQWVFQNGGTDRDDVEVSGPFEPQTNMSGPFEPRKQSNSHNDAFARAPTKSDERDGAQIETRRHKVKLVETEPILTESYRKKRTCVDEGRASSAEAATLQSAPEHAG